MSPDSLHFGIVLDSFSMSSSDFVTEACMASSSAYFPARTAPAFSTFAFATLHSFSAAAVGEAVQGSSAKTSWSLQQGVCASGPAHGRAAAQALPGKFWSNSFTWMHAGSDT